MIEKIESGNGFRFIKVVTEKYRSHIFSMVDHTLLETSMICIVGYL